MPRSRVVPVVGLAAALAGCADPARDPLTPSALRFSRGGGATVGGPVLTVTSAADAGPGSLRAALLAASADPRVRAVRIARRLGPIVLAAPLAFTGAQALTLDGGGTVVDGSNLPASATPIRDAALVVTGGGDFEARALTVRGSTGNGILVDVPAGRAGVVAVRLDDVTVEGSTRHGVLVNDQAGYFADPETRADAGSPAGVAVRVQRSAFVGNGFGGPDFDGLRVNEGGDGSLDVDIRHSRFAGNGGDGVELDERAAGNAEFLVQQTTITGNGTFDLAGDPDDGLDVDELGAGDLVGRFVQVVASDNAEQGIDLNENNLGDLRVTMNQVVAAGNAEEGVEFEEDDDVDDFPREAWGGALVATLDNVTATRNGTADGDAGLKLREKAAGDLVAVVRNADALDNAVTGVQLREGEDGDLRAEVIGARALRNAGEGVEVREGGGGAIAATLTAVTSADNADAGVRLRGNGEARLVRLAASGNGDGDVVRDAGVVVTRVP